MELTCYVEQTLLEVFENYMLRGHRIQEDIPLAQHMAQCGILARETGHDDEVVLAAFFHDIGHLLDPEEALTELGEYGLVDRELLGAQYLRRRGFSDRVGTLIEGRVAARRYLTFQDTFFLQRLSPAGRASLDLQGGPMTPEEAARFECRLDFLLCLSMHEWDEKAKRTDLRSLSYMPFKEVARRHLHLQFGDPRLIDS